MTTRQYKQSEAAGLELLCVCLLLFKFGLGMGIGCVVDSRRLLLES